MGYATVIDYKFLCLKTNGVRKLVVEKFGKLNIVSEASSRPWQLKFAWRPQRCYRSGQRIWLTWAYSGRSQYIINTPVLWMTKQEYLIKCLRND